MACLHDEILCSSKKEEVHTTGHDMDGARVKSIRKKRIAMDFFFFVELKDTLQDRVWSSGTSSKACALPVPV